MKKRTPDYFDASAKCCRNIEREELNHWPPEQEYRFRYYRRKGDETCELQVSYQGGEWQYIPLVEEGEDAKETS